MGFFDSIFRSNVNNMSVNRNIRSEDPDLKKVIRFNEEYAQEISSGESETNFENSYSNNGVQLTQADNSALKLTYSGILAQNGSKDVYSVIGYGNNLKWENVEFYPMSKTGQQTFEVTFPVRRSGNINIAFKDGSDHWDNNSGLNYTYFDQFNQGSH